MERGHLNYTAMLMAKHMPEKGEEKHCQFSYTVPSHPIPSKLTKLSWNMDKGK